MRVERISGQSRYETNERINAKLSDLNQNILTYGGNYADALSAVNLLNGSNKIVLLNNRNISSFNAKLIRENTNLVVGGLLSKEVDRYKG
ncbi:cell wall-binding repeat-containing protein [Parvimonas sp. G1604]|uniref:cell wall-binding repeat-containing protein n=1 Tax=Parvimonas sp. G1604 TaxID=3388845 RepID=UPI003CFFF0B8